MLEIVSVAKQERDEFLFSLFFCLNFGLFNLLMKQTGFSESGTMSCGVDQKKEDTSVTCPDLNNNLCIIQVGLLKATNARAF